MNNDPMFCVGALRVKTRPELPVKRNKNRYRWMEGKIVRTAHNIFSRLRVGVPCGGGPSYKMPPTPQNTVSCRETRSARTPHATLILCINTHKLVISRLHFFCTFFLQLLYAVDCQCVTGLLIHRCYFFSTTHNLSHLRFSADFASS